VTGSIFHKLMLIGNNFILQLFASWALYQIFRTNRFIQHFHLIILKLSHSWPIVWVILISKQWRIFMNINPTKA